MTLAQSSHYFLVFRNPADAKAYQSNVVRHYRYARAHTPTSIRSPSLPEPEAVFADLESRHTPEQEDVKVPSTNDSESPPWTNLETQTDVEPDPPITDAQSTTDPPPSIANFALCSPHQRLQLTYMYPPFSPPFQRLLDQGGYLGGRAGRALLLWIDDLPERSDVMIEDIRSLIEEDEQERNLAWGVEVENISDVVGQRKKQRNPDKVQAGINGERAEDDDANSKDNNNGAPEIEQMDADWNENMSSETSSSASSTSPSVTYGQRSPRFVLTFIESQDAKRFRRQWHKRRISAIGSTSTHASETSQSDDLGDDDGSVVNIEYLW